jgi:hypothetical protein
VTGQFGTPLLVFSADPETGGLDHYETIYPGTRDGNRLRGARALCFPPDGAFCYVVSQFENAISVLAFDTDSDGLPDAVESNEDTDGDGLPNAADTDSDGNGIDDAAEGAKDLDKDAIPGYLDPDNDGDGINDQLEGAGDADGDSIPNYRDEDSDNNGVADILEGAFENAGRPRDLDGDGTPDFLDLDDDGDGIGDTVEGTSDLDGDGLPNYADTDSDGDDIPDESAGAWDIDNNGILDFQETAALFLRARPLAHIRPRTPSSCACLRANQASRNWLLSGNGILTPTVCRTGSRPRRDSSRGARTS